EDVVPDEALDEGGEQRVAVGPHRLPLVALWRERPQRGRVVAGDRQVPGLVMPVDDAVGAAVPEDHAVAQAERRLAEAEDVDPHAAAIGRPDLTGQRLEVGAVAGYVNPLGGTPDEVVRGGDDRDPR